MIPSKKKKKRRSRRKTKSYQRRSRTKRRIRGGSESPRTEGAIFGPHTLRHLVDFASSVLATKTAFEKRHLTVHHCPSIFGATDPSPSVRLRSKVASVLRRAPLERLLQSAAGFEYVEFVGCGLHHHPLVSSYVPVLQAAGVEVMIREGSDKE